MTAIMGGDVLPAVIAKPLAIFVVDALVAGDNALVIALLCRDLPARRRGRVLLAATLGAVMLRLVLIAVAGVLLAEPAMKLLGGMLLALIALRLGAFGRFPLSWRAAGKGVLAAAWLLAVADMLLSLDNVVALASLADGDPLALALGLAGSILALMFASQWLTRLIAAEPWLGRLAAALLGGIAGRMALADPLIAGWIATQAPALPLIVPLLVAGYVAFVNAGPAARSAAPMALPRARAPIASSRVPAPVPARVNLVRLAIGRELAVFLALFAIAGTLLAGVVLLAGPPIR
ncbi:MAG: TerC family protein [Acidibrevibacterium sp.]|uniref:TerC family protein n=1 Tax=Acidibrevibacterium sp. TaxID=2606776 RepID=UPI003D04E903